MSEFKEAGKAGVEKVTVVKIHVIKEKSLFSQWMRSI